MASHTTFTELPQEILDEIVDQRHDDTRFLRACSLANSKLRPRAQSHLFKTVDLPSSERVHRLWEIVKQNPRIAAYISAVLLSTTSEQVIRDRGFDLSFLDLITFIIASSPQFKFRVYISGTPGVDYVQPVQGAFEDISAQQKHCLAAVTELTLTNIPKFPLSLFRKFTAATSLNLENASIELGLHITDLVKMNRHLLPGELHPVKYLAVSDVETDDFPLSLISRCHALDELELKNVTFYPDDTDGDEMMIDLYRPMLKRFFFSECDLPTIQALANSVVDFSNLEMMSDGEPSFGEEEVSVEDGRCANDIMKSCGRSLQTLRLFCTAGECPMLLQTLYNLSLVPRLRWLELVAPCRTNEHETYTPYYMCSLLNTINVQQNEIQDLIFHFEIEIYGDGDEVDPMEVETTDLPTAFRQGAWVYIKAVLARLMAHHTFNIYLNVTVVLVMEDKVSPHVSGTLSGDLDDWARQNLHEDTQTNVVVIEA